MVLHRVGECGGTTRDVSISLATKARNGRTARSWDALFVEYA